MSEYAFDVRMNAVVRVQADSRESAEQKVRWLQAVEIGKRVEPGILITEISVDESSPDLIEIDGQEVA